jgi:hypothetical protein
MEISVISLSISLIIVSFGFLSFLKRNSDAEKKYKNEEKEHKDEYNKLTRKYNELLTKYNSIKDYKSSYYSLYPGRKALIHNYGLKMGSESFSVNYEVEILEITQNKVKAKAYDFNSDSKIGNDPSLRQGILNIINNTWINLDRIDPILDINSIRDSKINNILND